jgi:hypothetical protein
LHLVGARETVFEAVGERTVQRHRLDGGFAD